MNTCEQQLSVWRENISGLHSTLFTCVIDTETFKTALASVVAMDTELASLKQNIR